MEECYLFESEGFSNEDFFERLSSALVKESEILDEDNIEFEGIEELSSESINFDKFQSEKHFSPEFEPLKTNKEGSKTSEERIISEEQTIFCENDKSSNHLLRRTISELERALSDTRKLLADRDLENSKVRSQFIALQSSLEDEKSKCSQLMKNLDEKKAIIMSLEKQILKKESGISDQKILKSDGEVNEQKEFCCDNDRNFHKLKLSNIELEKEVKDLKIKLHMASHQSISSSKTLQTDKRNNDIETRSKCKHFQREKNLETKLRMKFMRDAFFYYMIDYHAEEQLRAILAILEYEDRRQDIILESHKMRQKGRKFTVSQVSSRKFTFVQEEHK